MLGTRASLPPFPSNLWSRNSAPGAPADEISLRLEIHTQPLPLLLASGLWLLISPQASESSLKGTCARVHFCSLLLVSLSSLAHLRRPQSGQINNVGASIPPAMPVIRWKCGCCSACPVSLGNQIVRMHTHERNNPNTRGDAGDGRGHFHVSIRDPVMTFDVKLLMFQLKMMLTRARPERSWG